MELQRFIAADMEAARAAVLQDLGPEAVIISTTDRDDGVELLAAVNFDPNLLTTLSRNVSPREQNKPAPQTNVMPKPAAKPRVAVAAATKKPIKIEPEGVSRAMKPETEDDISGLQQSLQRELKLLTEYRHKRAELDEHPDLVREEVQAELFMLRKSLKSELEQLDRYREQRQQAEDTPDPDTVRLHAQLSTLQSSLEGELSALAKYHQRRVEMDTEADPKAEALQKRLDGLQKCLADELLKLEEYRHKQTALDAELDPTRNRRWTDLANLQDALASELSQLSEYRLQRLEQDAQSDPITENLQQCLTDTHQVLQRELEDFRTFRAEQINSQADIDLAAKTLQEQLREQHQYIAEELKQFASFRNDQQQFLADVNPATLELQDNFLCLHQDLRAELDSLRHYHQRCQEMDEARAPAVAALHSELRESQALLQSEVAELQLYRQQRMQQDAIDDSRTTRMHEDWDHMQALLKAELQELISYRDERQAIDARTDPVNQGLQQELLNLQRALRDEVVQITRQRQQREELDDSNRPVVAQMQSDCESMLATLQDEVEQTRLARREFMDLQQNLQQELLELKELKESHRTLDEATGRQQESLAAELVQLSDYRKQLHSLTNEPEQKPELEVPDRIKQLGLAPEINRVLAERLSDQPESGTDWPTLLDAYGQLFQTGADEIVSNGGIVAVVGSTGVGKTTTVAKLAAQYTARHGKGKVALVSTDSLRIGGATQLETFAHMLDLPLACATSATELAQQLQLFEGYDLVLIDTAGISQRDVRLADQLRSLPQHVSPYLVLSATSGTEVTREVITAFQSVRISGVIVTKVDEAASLGAVMSGVIQCQLPVTYLCNGQNVPDDIREATREDLKRFTRVLVHRRHKAQETTSTESLRVTEALSE